MKKKQKKIIIIGAGPCGLGAAWRLKELGYDNFTLYEKEAYVGGLATSFVDAKGFTWDIGGHVLHSHYPYFDQVFEKVMQGDFFTHQRKAWAYLFNTFVPYPVQNNIRYFPEHIRNECLNDLKKINAQPKNATDFYAWMQQSFGKGIARHFLAPLNRKSWSYPLNKMSTQWMSDRIAPVDVKRIEENVHNGKDDVDWGPNNVFHFPKKGGTATLWNKVAKGVSSHLRFNMQVTAIDGKKRQIIFSDGTRESFDYILTTIPLDRLVRLIKGIKIDKKTTNLKHNSICIVGLGVAGKVPQQLAAKCWMYFPEKQVPFFRATVLSNYSKYNAPVNTWSLMTETTYSKSRELPKSIEKMVIEAIRKMHFVSSGTKIVNVWKYSAHYGYPIPTLDRDEFIHRLIPKLEIFDIYSRGRFGLWKYEVSNQDHTFMQGVEWVDRIVYSKKETTIGKI